MFLLLNNKKYLILTIVSAILILASISVALYPTLSHTLTNQKLIKQTETFEEHIKDDNIIPADKTREQAIDEKIIDEEGYVLDENQNRKYSTPAYYEVDLKRLYEDSVKYNKELVETQYERLKDTSWTDTSLNLEDYGITDDIYAYVSIPSIDLKLPIYLGATEYNMENGAAHLTHTSLPIGGKNSNCVLAGHTGYFGRTFFDEINQLDIGDEVNIVNFWRTLHYKVVSINVLPPNDGSNLFIEKDKDLLTLFTCKYHGDGKFDRYYVVCERT